MYVILQRLGNCCDFFWCFALRQNRFGGALTPITVDVDFRKTQGRKSQLVRPGFFLFVAHRDIETTRPGPSPDSVDLWADVWAVSIRNTRLRAEEDFLHIVRRGRLWA